MNTEQKFVKEMFEWAASEFEIFNEILVVNSTWVESAASGFIHTMQNIPSGKTFVETFAELYPHGCLAENGYESHMEDINDLFMKTWLAK